jgi:predicted metalloprotease with PDZ domain
MRNNLPIQRTYKDLMRRLFWLAGLGLSSLGQAVVHYHIDFQPAAKQLWVTIQLDNPGESETFRIPAWAPGFYQIAQYQDGISQVEARTPDGKTLMISRDGDRGWKVADQDRKPIVFSYRVKGDEAGLGFFATAVHDADGYVCGASAMMYVDGRITEPDTLKVEIPTGWDIATPLDPDQNGEYQAGGYDELIDSPIQVGRFVRKSFTAMDRPFQVIFVAPDGHPKADLDYETTRISKLVTPAIKMFGKTPFKHYTFFLHLAPGSFSGGLEHRASTVIDIQNSKPLGIDDLLTHEYFHAWNVKNIRPAVLGPFDYTKDVRTDNLWFAEGVTDYYAKLDAYKSGLNDLTYLIEQLTEVTVALQHSRDRTKYTLAQASRGAWEGGSEGLGDLSYYDKGLLVGLILDANIRSVTGGKKSLDDVMRTLYDRHHLPLPGYAEDEIRTTINEVSGTDFKNLYNTLIYSTNELPYEDVQKIGIRVITPNHAFRDPGFRVDALGKVTEVDDSAKEKGLRLDDSVVVEGTEGPVAMLSVKRGNLNFRVTLPIKASTGTQYRVEPDPLATQAACKLREAWLSR